jgi:hypothetical protein
MNLAASNPGSKFHSFGQQLRYFFGQQFLLKWAANIFNEIIFYKR